MIFSLADLAQLIQTTLRLLQMYTAKHPRTHESTQALLDKLNGHFQSAPAIKIAVSNGRLFMDGQPGEIRNIHINNLCKMITDHSIAGIQISSGIDLEELTNLLEMLLLKPQRLDEMGGPEAVIASKNMAHVRLTQTRFLEAEEGEELTSSPLEHITDDEKKTRVLFNMWLARFRDCIEAGVKGAEDTSWTPPFKGALPAADLSGIGRLAVELGWGGDSPPVAQWEALQAALANLTAAERLSIVSGRASLPGTPPSLAKAMDGFIPNTMAEAAAKLDDEGAEWSGLKEAVYSAITSIGNVAVLYKAFGTLWIKRGKGSAQVSEIKDLLEWDYQPLEKKLSVFDKPELLWSLANGQRNRLIAQAMEKLSPGAFRGLLKIIIDAFTGGNANLRESAADTLEIVASHIEVNPISKETEDALLASLTAVFIREPEQRVLAATLKCLKRLIITYLHRHDFSRAAKLLAELDACCASRQPAPSNQIQMLAKLKSDLCTKENIELVLNPYFESGPDYFNDTALPWLRALGSNSIEYLMEMLAEENDRRRRNQIMKAIQAYGGDIVPILLHSLDSDKWYVVRNVLILIAEMPDESCFNGVVKCLGHPDPRVVRVAVRTLWRAFGKRAAKPLLSVFEEVEPDIFEEILFGLANIPALEAIPAALSYAVDANNPERLRAMALDVLAVNPSIESLPVLTDIVKRKGHIVTTAEPAAIRISAAKAMVAIGQEGREQLQSIAKSEPRGDEKDEFNYILES